MRNLIFALAITLTGCATQTALDLKKSESEPLSWTVPLPIHIVYKDYKEYADKNIGGWDFWWGNRYRVVGDYYGEDEGAELDVKIREGALYGKTFLHLEFQNNDDDHTNITGWYYDSTWKDSLSEFMEIHK